MSSELAEKIAERLKRFGVVNAAELHRTRREVSKQLRGEPAQAVWQLANELMTTSSTAGRFFACALVRNHPAAFAKVTATKLERLGAGMSSWADVDIFATLLAGHAFREGLVSGKVVQRWARAKDMWWRRAALVSTVGLNVQSHGGQGDAARTLAVCELLLDDREDMVVKAMSWALRALAVRDPRAVHDFLSSHQDVLAARVLREVRNKLKTGLKTPKRASRASRRVNRKQHQPETHGPRSRER